MNINKLIRIFFLLIISSIEIGQSLVPVERHGHSAVLVDKKLYFFGGESVFGKLKNSIHLDQILYIDLSKPFNTANPPFEEVINAPMPFGSSYATAFLSPQKKNIIYLFGGIMWDVNANVDKFKSILYSYNVETNEWIPPATTGIAPEKRREINGVINNETGKFYAFSGLDTNAQNVVTTFNDMNILDINSLTWSKGSITNAPLPRVDYTATLLSNGIIVFIGGRETNNLVSVDINQLPLYDTKVDRWSTMTARGVTLENRNSHSAILTSDEKIIVFGGNKDDIATPVLNPLAVLNTKVVPYEWSVPTPAPPLPLTTNLHSATLVENYMFINFGQVHPKNDSLLQKPFFYILDVRNFTWVEKFEPEQLSQSPNGTTTVNTSSTNSPGLGVTTPDNGKQIGIIIGAVGISVGVIAVAGLLGYKYYKKQKYTRAIPTAGSPIL
ncbi:uncharacterized protein OCT59_023201 [Rhizophagus irregularis]|uniref:Kel2p n=1 Tax=Rhizophagus irregularis (strain DAOM 197198w) TaxID=1432141 RepID=A0A015KHC4_RHIIW|nr:Kel2p [Rhizophagus irregularis DAOM 197198w]UZO29741.1 hypothetical protein OCT59_023201 [Rhizophagus irregularis]GBC34969.2 hypothetical protein GLOIN_2v1532947 [Rhizophagus irregularis DAOM 181602=DAOM 197198]